MMTNGNTLRTEGWLTTLVNESAMPLLLQGLRLPPVALPSLSVAPGTVATLLPVAVVAGKLSDPWGDVITPVFIVAIAAAMLFLLQLGGSDGHIHNFFVSLEHLVAHLQGGFESQRRFLHAQYHVGQRHVLATVKRGAHVT